MEGIDERVGAYLETNHRAIMTTISRAQRPHVARVDIGVVEGRLWSSGTQDRVRTGHLRANPACALAVLDRSSPYNWLGLDCDVEILEGPEAPEMNLALYRRIAKEPEDVQEYLDAMVRERRLIYEFRVRKTYGHPG